MPYASDLPDHHLIDLCRDRKWDALLSFLATLSVEEKRHFAECVGKGNKLTLHYACANNAPLSVIEALIGASRDALSKPDKNGCVPLHFVCFSRHDEKVLLSVLFEFPAATLMSDARNRTPLHFALSNIEAFPLSLETFELLSSDGAASMPDSDGKLPLHYACVYSAGAEIIASLLQAYPRSISAVDNLGRNALHYSLGNADTPQQPEKVKLLLEANPKIIDGVDNEKKTPLDQLADTANAGILPSKGAERANVYMCLHYVLKSGFTPTPKALQTMQSFPTWLKEKAVTTHELQKVLNEKISQRVPTAILLLNFYAVAMILVCYRIVTWAYLENRCNEDEDCLIQRCALIDQETDSADYDTCEAKVIGDVINNKEQADKIAVVPLVLLFLGAAFFLVKQMSMAISLSGTSKFKSVFTFWIRDSGNIVEIITFSLVLVTLTIIRRFSTSFEITSMSDFFALSTGFFWLSIIWLLKSTYVDFAVFVGGIIHVGANLVAFLTTVGIILFAFTQMLLTLYQANFVCLSYFCVDDFCPNIQETCKPGLDCPPFCEDWHAGLRVFTMMIGAVDETQFQDIPEARILFVIYMILVVIILLNVLIAIVTESYAYIKDQRAEVVFWCNRLDFVSAVETMTIGTVATMRGFCRNIESVEPPPEAPRNRRGSLARQASVVATQVAHKADKIFLEGEHNIKRVFWDNLIRLSRGSHGDDDGYVELSVLETLFVVISRFLTIVVIIPLWIALGLLTAGWLWPPQVREALFNGKYTSVDSDAEDDKEAQESERVSELQNEVKAVRTELTKLTEVMEAFMASQLKS